MLPPGPHSDAHPSGDRNPSTRSGSGGLRFDRALEGQSMATGSQDKIKHTAARRRSEIDARDAEGTEAESAGAVVRNQAAPVFAGRTRQRADR